MSPISSFRMISFAVALMALALTPADMHAQEEEDFDIRKFVRPPGEVKEKDSELIDPGNSYFGQPHGATEDEMIETLGQPDGYLRLRDGWSMMIYGTNHGYLCHDGKLAGIRVGTSIVDFTIAKMMEGGMNGMRERNWRMVNGVSNRMSLVQVKRLLGDELHKDSYRWMYSTNDCVVTLHFSRRMDQGEGDDAYHIMGIMVQSDE